LTYELCDGAVISGGFNSPVTGGAD